MKLIDEVIRLRLRNQLLTNHPFNSVYDVVKWMGAVQAQDYYGSLWAVGLRMKKANESMVEKAIADRQVVRSWPMRGTLHLTAPEDLRPMLKLLAPRIIKKGTRNYELAGLDSKVFNKASSIIIKELEKTPVLTRGEIYEVLERSGISTKNVRGLHILGWMALHAMICFAARKGKQATFALLDDWIPDVKPIDDDEAFHNITLQYFRSHGPATIQDFCWWTGLNLSEAKIAIGFVEGKLSRLKRDPDFLFSEESTSGKGSGTILIPAYDEYTVGYKERLSLVDDRYISKASNGILSPCVVMNGKIAGTWSRTKQSGALKLKLFGKLTEKEKGSLEKARGSYDAFLTS